MTCELSTGTVSSVQVRGGGPPSPGQGRRSSEDLDRGKGREEEDGDRLLPGHSSHTAAVAMAGRQSGD